MDLKSFLEFHIQNGTIVSVLKGMESSEFYPYNSSMPNLIKQILAVKIPDVQQKVYNQLQSGGISSMQLVKGAIDKKQSFCTDFNVIISNLQALLGFEYNRHIQAIMILKLQMKSIIEEIKKDISYKTIRYHIEQIYNILSLTNYNNEKVITIDNEFNASKFKSPFLLISNQQENMFNYNADMDDPLSVLASIVRSIDRTIESRSIAGFDSDKTYWLKILNEMYEHAHAGTYIITSINDLVINLDEYSIGYTGSLIENYQMLFYEAYTKELIYGIKIKAYDKHMKYLKYIGIDDGPKYASELVRYYKLMYMHAKQTVKQDVDVVLLSKQKHKLNPQAPAKLNPLAKLMRMKPVIEIKGTRGRKRQPKPIPPEKQEEKNLPLNLIHKTVTDELKLSSRVGTASTTDELETQDSNDELFNLEKEFQEIEQEQTQQSSTDSPKHLPAQTEEPVTEQKEEKGFATEKMETKSDAQTEEVKDKQLSTQPMIDQVNDLVDVKITESFCSSIANVTLNFFIQLSLMIAKIQKKEAQFGKSNRIQFIQIIIAMMCCTSRTLDYTDSQEEAIHYALLSEKVLTESYKYLIRSHGL